MSSEIHECIRAGKIAEAQKLLHKILRRKSPRADRTELAAFCRRVGWPERGLGLLHPILHPRLHHPVVATEAEKAEYAACLVRLGLYREAKSLFQSIKHITPDLLLFQASWHVSRWDYAGALPFYRELLKSPEVTPYQKLIAHVNLAAALIYLRDALKASALIQKLLRETLSPLAKQLRGPTLSLAAQNFIFQKKPLRALAFLEEARQTLTDEKSVEALLVEKWHAVARLMATPKSAAAQKDLLKVRARAEAAGHRESIRDCDRWLGVLTKDTTLVSRVWFGTPWPSYRAHLELDTKSFWERPETFALSLGGPNPKASLALNQILERAQSQPTTQRLVHQLARDFYTAKVGSELFGEVYSDEFFNPATSPTRLRKAVQRANQFLKAKAAPLVISVDKTGYFLSASKPVALGLAPEKEAMALGGEIAELERAFGAGEFSIGDAVTALGSTRRSAQRWLNQAVKAQKLERYGTGPRTRYRVRTK